MTAHEAYCKAFAKCQQARDKGKRYIAIQLLKQGGVRLLATNDPGNQESCCAQDVQSWAENVVYRLDYLGALDDDPDAYFDALNKTGY